MHRIWPVLHKNRHRARHPRRPHRTAPLTAGKTPGRGKRIFPKYALRPSWRGARDLQVSHVEVFCALRLEIRVKDVRRIPADRHTWKKPRRCTSPVRPFALPPLPPVRSERVPAKTFVLCRHARHHSWPAHSSCKQAKNASAAFERRRCFFQTTSMFDESGGSSGRKLTGPPGAVFTSPS